MTAEQAFKLFRSYKLFFNGEYDNFIKYGPTGRVPPLIKQLDRSFYYKIANKLGDAQIHALYAQTLFFNPRAHVSECVSGDRQDRALLFAARTENGAEILKRDLYELAKQLRSENLLEWLYGEEGTSIPPCLQQVINRELPLDVACLLFLIPQREHDYEWATYWTTRPDSDFGLGAKQWIERLYKSTNYSIAGPLSQRPAWRQNSHKLAKAFWGAMSDSYRATLVGAPKSRS
jgi:hypothetical protein